MRAGQVAALARQFLHLPGTGIERGVIAYHRLYQDHMQVGKPTARPRQCAVGVTVQRLPSLRIAPYSRQRFAQVETDPPGVEGRRRKFGRDGVRTKASPFPATQPILTAANALIELASERYTKNLWTDRTVGELPQLVCVRDEADQVSYVVECVLENREAGLILKQQAVLFRASHHSGLLEVELTRRNIPFVKFGGLKFLDAAHIKDLLAVLRFVENPRDRISGFRVLQLVQGVGCSIT